MEFGRNILKAAEDTAIAIDRFTRGLVVKRDTCIIFHFDRSVLDKNILRMHVQKERRWDYPGNMVEFVILLGLFCILMFKVVTTFLVSILVEWNEPFKFQMAKETQKVCF